MDKVGIKYVIVTCRRQDQGSQFRNLTALSCSIPSVARMLLKFLNCVDPLVKVFNLALWSRFLETPIWAGLNSTWWSH